MEARTSRPFQTVKMASHCELYMLASYYLGNTVHRCDGNARLKIEKLFIQNVHSEMRERNILGQFNFFCK